VFVVVLGATIVHGTFLDGIHDTNLGTFGWIGAMEKLIIILSYVNDYYKTTWHWPLFFVD
jgi:hypothetical protein